MRQQEGLFVAEGSKAVTELIETFPCRMILGTRDMLRTIVHKPHAQRIEEIPNSFPFEKLSSLQTPRPLLAVFETPATPAPAATELNRLCLLLDTVQDPGNLGTIIRTANWFGIQQIFLTPGCADPWSPKVVQACMGALAGVQLHQLNNPEQYLQTAQATHIPIFGSFLEAPSLYTTVLPKADTPAIFIAGNEGRGISPSLEALCSHKLHIPPAAGNHTESLNVAIATAIVLAYWLQPR